MLLEGLMTKKFPDSFRRYGVDVLAGHPEIVHQWSGNADRCNLFIPTTSPKEFDVSFKVSENLVTLC
jgi:hypothetical protein